MSNLNMVLSKLKQMYDSEPKQQYHKKRFERLNEWFINKVGSEAEHFFSTPGRVEIGGNHTDHNHGRVLAASVDMDSIAVASSCADNRVILYSEGYDPPFIVALDDLGKKDSEVGTTTALIRGIAAGLKMNNWKIGGFQACMTSDVLPGSGLSSSASVEVLIGTIFSALYNDDQINPEIIAQIGQYAENEYFGKPCGLMDQMACAVGGIISIDFEDPGQPKVKKVAFDADEAPFRLLVVDTGGNHADLTSDYAAIPQEMKAVAALAGKKVCRELNKSFLMDNLNLIRKQLGDRAFLRAWHFLGENDRVTGQVAALEEKRFDDFLALVHDSGNSSFKYLQNVYTQKAEKTQGLTLGLALSEDFIEQRGCGAARVHGGGFAGTILAFLANQDVEDYRKLMESVFSTGSVKVLNIRASGTVHWNEAEIR